jgi:hypothetical protein
VRSVDRASFARNVDQTPEGKHRLEAFERALAALTKRELPVRLMKNPRMKESRASGKVVVTTYHRYDPFALDEDLYEVLDRFSPEDTVAANLARLAAEGLVLVPELVDYLVTAGVLVPPADPHAPRGKTSDDRPGRRAALLAVLDARGLSVSDELLERIRTASVASLDGWIRRAAMASATDDVFAEAEG